MSEQTSLNSVEGGQSVAVTVTGEMSVVSLTDVQSANETSDAVVSHEVIGSMPLAVQSSDVVKKRLGEI